MGLNSQLRKLANFLPPYPDPTKKRFTSTVMVLGSVLVSQGVTHIKGDNFGASIIDAQYKVPVDPKKTYSYEEKFVPIDHFKALRRVYDRYEKDNPGSGWTGVNWYADKVTEWFKKQQVNAK